MAHQTPQMVNLAFVLHHSTNTAPLSRTPPFTGTVFISFCKFLILFSNTLRALNGLFNPIPPALFFLTAQREKDGGLNGEALYSLFVMADWWRADASLGVCYNVLSIPSFEGSRRLLIDDYAN